MSTTIDGTGQRLDIIDEVGDDVTLVATVTDENGDPYVWTGVTVEATIGTKRDGSGADLAEWAIDTSTAGTLILNLDTTATATLGAGHWWYGVRVTESGAPETWLWGQVELRATVYS